MGDVDSRPLAAQIAWHVKVRYAATKGFMSLRVQKVMRTKISEFKDTIPISFRALDGLIRSLCRAGGGKSAFQTNQSTRDFVASSKER